MLLCSQALGMTNTRLVYNRDGSVVCEQCHTIIQDPSAELPAYTNNNYNKINTEQGRVVNSPTVPNSSSNDQQHTQYSSAQNTQQTSGTVVDSK